MPPLLAQSKNADRELVLASIDDSQRSQSRSDRAQRALDLFVAATALVLAAPVVGLAMLIVRVSSPGPAIYTQTRLGRFGRPFTIYKIRSMAHDCEKKSGVKWSVKDDVRVTRVGRILRNTHIDELPQLINILRGEMSLVGPRPERPEIVVSLESVLPQYRDRLLVRPGLTGLAQVQLPPDTDTASVRRKLRYDQHYVARGSVWLDVRLLVGTAFHVFGLPFELSRRMLRLPGERDVEPTRQISDICPADSNDTATHSTFPTRKEESVDVARA